MTNSKDPQDLSSRMCENYPDCGLTAWACNRLQDLVYDDMPTTEKRKLAAEIRRDNGEVLTALIRDEMLALIGEDEKQVIERWEKDKPRHITNPGAVSRNQLRRELRTKVEQRFGGGK